MRCLAMHITSEFAQSIVEEMEKIIQRNINFMNESGVIIASIDKSRIGSVHEGARAAVQTKKRVVITKTAIEKGVKPGMNLRVLWSQRVVGGSGITGPVDEVDPFGNAINRR